MNTNLSRGAALPLVIVIVIILALGGFLWWRSAQAPTDSTTYDDTVVDADGTMTDKKTDDAMMDGENTTHDDTSLDQAPVTPLAMQGVYEEYSPEKIARAEEGDVVLFFHAKWCPTCRGLDSNIMGNLSAIPKGVSILKVDYDTETALKKKYGITYQHTLVQVDKDGNQIAKWSGSPTLSDLVKNIK